jgi:hypothetical protein
LAERILDLFREIRDVIRDWVIETFGAEEIITDFKQTR